MDWVASILQQQADEAPGETMRSMLHRAVWSATGGGRLLVRLRLRSEEVR